jgi:hypothetical protein
MGVQETVLFFPGQEERNKLPTERGESLEVEGSEVDSMSGDLK